MNKQIHALTATRAIAAILIVVYHYGKQLSPYNDYMHFFVQANIAVGYFFVLSGFVMFWTYQERKPSYGKFIVKRVARIAPVYYLALLLAISVIVYDHHFLEGEPLSNFTKGIVLNATFLQSYFPGYALSINTPAWSLSVEMLFYLSFPLFLMFAQRNKKGFIWFVIVFFIVSQVVHHVMFKDAISKEFSNETHELVFYHPLLHLNQFLIGILGVYLVAFFRKIGFSISPFMMLVSVFLLLHFPRSVSIHNGILAPLFLLMIVGVVLKEPRFLKLKPMVFLGEISYGIYILQAPVYYYVEQWNNTRLHLSEQKHFYLYLSILIVVSASSYYLLEKPMRKKINALVSST